MTVVVVINFLVVVAVGGAFFVVVTCLETSVEVVNGSVNVFCRDVPSSSPVFDNNSNSACADASIALFLLSK